MYLYLAIGLALVIKGADFLVMGASSIARRFNISSLVIGLTVVSFGTSLPELIIALISGAQGKSDFIIGNVVGSNIANVLLVLGIAAMIRALPATSTTVWREIPITLIASFALVFMANDWYMGDSANLAVNRTDGIILLVLMAGFMGYVAHLVRTQGADAIPGLEAPEEQPMFRSIAEIVGGILGLYFGGDMAVNMGAVPIAESWGMSDAFIGLTVIAVGTSLPELATSAVAAYKKNVDIAVGNVVGSNIFNIFFVLGINAAIRDIPFRPELNIDLYVMTATTLALFFCMFTSKPKHTIHRYEGALFVIAYIAYTGFLIHRG